MKKVALSLAAIIALAVAGYGGYRLAEHRQMSAAPEQGAASAAPGATDKQVLYWYDPMYPQSRFDKPGKSPFMDMQLVPKYAGEASDQGSVSISPTTVQNLGIRTAEVKRGSVAPKLSAVGAVEYNERLVVVVQPRANGFIERLHIRAPLDSVRQGAPLVEMLIPDWAAAQEEYLL